MINIIFLLINRFIAIVPIGGKIIGVILIIFAIKEIFDELRIGKNPEVVPKYLMLVISGLALIILSSVIPTVVGYAVLFGIAFLIVKS